MATIVMKSAKVIEAATAMIEHINEERMRRDEVTVLRAMQPYKKWFKTYTRTREEAIKYLDECDNNSMFDSWHSMYAWGTLDKARAILKLAQHGDPVTLNQEDIEVLF